MDNAEAANRRIRDAIGSLRTSPMCAAGLHAEAVGRASAAALDDILRESAELFAGLAARYEELAADAAMVAAAFRAAERDCVKK